MEHVSAGGEHTLVAYGNVRIITITRSYAYSVLIMMLMIAECYPCRLELPGGSRVDLYCIHCIETFIAIKSLLVYQWRLNFQ